MCDAASNEVPECSLTARRLCIVALIGGCRLLKVGGRAVLLIGAEFLQPLLNCVDELNNELNSADDTDNPVPTSDHVSSDTTQPCTVQSSDVLASDTSHSADSIITDASHISVVNSVVSVQSDSVRTTAEDGHDITDSEYVMGGTLRGRMTNRCPIWMKFLEHYVKLGETHAYICGFTKNR